MAKACLALFIRHIFLVSAIGRFILTALLEPRNQRLLMAEFCPMQNLSSVPGKSLQVHQLPGRAKWIALQCFKEIDLPFELIEVVTPRDEGVRVVG